VQAWLPTQKPIDLEDEIKESAEREQEKERMANLEAEEESKQSQYIQRLTAPNQNLNLQ
jgi:hypothetical protein